MKLSFLSASSIVICAVVATNDNGPSSLTTSELWKLQQNFWDRFMYPANLKEVDAVKSTIFAPNVQGRVDITRTFDGAELNTEYVFGLFSDPSLVGFVGIPVAYEIRQFAASENIVSASTIVTYNDTTFGIQFPVTIDTFMTWDTTTKQITQYDATFKWFGFLLDTLITEAALWINATSHDQAIEFLAKTYATSLCDRHANYCHDKNQQYTDSTSCHDFVTKQIRFGQAFELGGNTLLCRMVHVGMIKFRPDVHCSHIGPSGGGMCVDNLSYMDVVTRKYFTNSPFIPQIQE